MSLAEDIALGKHPDLTTVRKFGENGDVDAAEDMIEIGGSVPYSTTGQLLEIVSSTATDIFSGWAEGLDANYDWVKEYFTMDGVTPVGLTTEWYSSSKARLTNGGAKGTVVVREDGGGATWLQISAGFGGTLHGAFGIPAGYMAILQKWEVCLTKPAASGSVHVHLISRPSGQTEWTIEDTIDIDSDVHNNIQAEFLSRPTVFGPADIKIRIASVSAASMVMSGSFDLILRRDAGLFAGPTEVNKP